MKKIFFKFNFLIFFIPLLFASCNKNNRGDHDVCEVHYPQPLENPFQLTSQPQTKQLYVKYITGIEAENPKTDKIVRNIVQTDESNLWMTIENDWIKIKHGDNLPENTIEITVKENTTGDPRSYKLITSYAAIHKTVLTIIQQ